MDEPTKEQVREFWECCGFQQLPVGNKNYHFEATVKTMDWQSPDGTSLMPYLPRIDLNSLFKYAVPKLENPLIVLHLQEEAWLCQVYHAEEEGKPYKVGVIGDKDLTLSLFWAIYSVLYWDTDDSWNELK